ncbi:hypothetical protein [Mesoterricola sediminis]|uniref:DUF4845 domain-containing protein n=1 Tax=Mesoterricola sediminis TaxID=2927980 RepID=A0AA48H3B8_9BACT|nr:hypothetical protein [Mesoterricola sediminis]BDU75238.1 hypothetical protein METESE_01960 [Mesoterricola sediminis]
MTTTRTHERGEGKIGCIVSLLVFILLAAVAAKVVPVFYANNELTRAAEDLGSRAAFLNAPGIEQQIRAKAVELEIPEALQKGAIDVKVTGDRSGGTCTIRLNYSRKVDLYGAYSFTLDTDKTVSRPWMDAR